MAEAEQHPKGSAERKESERKAAALSTTITATLTLNAAQLVGHVEDFWHLLPISNLKVTLAGHVISQAVVELIPESVARENLVLALHVKGHQLFVATTEPADYDTTQKLQFILNKDIGAVRAETDEILAAINWFYGQTETESVVSITYESPLIGLEGDPVSFAIAGLFVGAFSQHEYGRSCDGFEIDRTANGASVVYLDGTNPVASEDAPRGVYDRLLDHLLSLPVDAEYVANGLPCRRFDIPLLSRRRFPATLVRPSDGGEKWFRVRFRWEDRE
jgi:hypothetical protein